MNIKSQSHLRERVLRRGRGPELGVTLVEVLVSLVILSVAMLGIAGLQAATTSYQQGASNRATLSFQINDMTGRIRSNLTQVAGFDPAASAAGYAYSASWSAQQSAISAPSKLCGTESTAVACDSVERAAYDIYMWRKQVRAAVPQGSVLLAGDLSKGLTMSFMWFDKDNLSGGVLRPVNVCPASYAAGHLLGHDVVNGEATLDKQVCCPAVAAAPQGVRCANFTVLP
jgi:type IV pilus assembly protein PilV